MIEFLGTLDLNGKTVFEFGAGGSTLYWSKRGATVTSVELNGDWYEELQKLVPHSVTLKHEPDGHAYAAACDGSKYDVILIDGAERFRCAESSLRSIAPGGMIILDNAEWYPRTADLLRKANFIEIPFSGFGPINAFTSTTTAFLDRAFHFPSKERTPPIGGRSISALDDEHTSVRTVGIDSCEPPGAGSTTGFPFIVRDFAGM
jgi:hypothetical protein